MPTTTGNKYSKANEYRFELKTPQSSTPKYLHVHGACMHMNTAQEGGKV